MWMPKPVPQPSSTHRWPLWGDNPRLIDEWQRVKDVWDAYAEPSTIAE